MRFVLLTNKNSKELVEFINEVYNKRDDFGNRLKQKFKCEFIPKCRVGEGVVKFIWEVNGFRNWKEKWKL